MTGIIDGHKRPWIDKCERSMCRFWLPMQTPPKRWVTNWCIKEKTYCFRAYKKCRETLGHIMGIKVT
jgi:hypothetical protein